MNRAYVTLQFRAVDDEERIIEGVASTDAVDDYGTILEPKGARFVLPMPLLWQHRADAPVGEVLDAKVSGRRITVRAKLARIAEAGPLKDDIDRAWQAVKHGLVKGLSVGFKPVDDKIAGGTGPNDPIRFLEWIWRELSLVTLPANTEASITAIRSADRAVLAASGDSLPGVSGSQPTSTTTPRRGHMTTQEQIQNHENSRAAKLAQRQAIIDRCGEDGRTPDPTEREQLDTLAGEVRSHDEYLTTLYEQRTQNERAAQPVAGQSIAAATASRGAAEPAMQNRGGVPVVRVQSSELPGLGFARYAMSLAACKGNRFEAAEYARSTWGDQGEGVALMHRAAVAAGTTTNSTFAAPLVQTNYLNEFLELLRPATLIGRIPGLRRVPFNISLPAQTAGGTYSWVGQGVAKPVTNAAFASVTLGTAKAAGIIVLTEELVRSSQPSAQETVRNEMISGMQQYLDTQFVDPTVAAVANVSPASITNGVTGTAASATTEAAARTDLRARIGAFATANYGLGGLVILMGESLAFSLGTVVNAVGDRSFPDLTVNGGSILGIPVVTSNVTPLTTRIVLVHAPSILFADDGQTEIDISREASIIMNDAPSAVTQTAGAAPIHTSLWQNNLVGLRAERFINWGKARSTAVDMITTVAYA